MDLIWNWWNSLTQSLRENVIGGIAATVVGGLILGSIALVVGKMRRGLPEKEIPSTATPKPTQELSQIQHVIINVTPSQTSPLQPSMAQAVHASTLPASLIPRAPVIGFVARRDSDGRDLTEFVGNILVSDSAFVVLWGAGGIGKTALATEIARKWETVIWTSADGRIDFSLGILLDEIVTQLGRADLRVLRPEEKLSAVRNFLAGRHPLIVLDNFETVADTEQTRLIEFLATAPCPALVTSRQIISDRRARNTRIDAMGDAEAREFVNKLIEISPRREAFAGLNIAEIIKVAGSNPLAMEWLVAQIGQAQEPYHVFKELADGRGDAAQRIFDRSFSLPYLGNRGRTLLLALTLFAPNASRQALAAVAGLGATGASASEREALADDAGLDATEDRASIDQALELEGVDVKGIGATVARLVALRLAETNALNARVGVAGLTRELAKAHRERDSRRAVWVNSFIDYFVDYAKAQSIAGSKGSHGSELERENLLAAMEMAFANQNWYGVGWISRVIVGHARLEGSDQLWANAVARAEETSAAAFGVVKAHIHELRIYYSRTDDQDEDVRRMRELLGLLRSRPGRDRFIFFVPNSQGTVQLDFPNYATNYEAVKEPLSEMVGSWGSLEVIVVL